MHDGLLGGGGSGGGKGRPSPSTYAGQELSQPLLRRSLSLMGFLMLFVVRGGISAHTCLGIDVDPDAYRKQCLCVQGQEHHVGAVRHVGPPPCRAPSCPTGDCRFLQSVDTYPSWHVLLSRLLLQSAGLCVLQYSVPAVTHNPLTPVKHGC